MVVLVVWWCVLIYVEGIVGWHELISRDLSDRRLGELVVLDKIWVGIYLLRVDLVVFDGWLCSGEIWPVGGDKLVCGAVIWEIGKLGSEVT